MSQLLPHSRTCLFLVWLVVETKLPLCLVFTANVKFAILTHLLQRLSCCGSYWLIYCQCCQFLFEFSNNYPSNRWGWSHVQTQRSYLETADHYVHSVCVLLLGEYFLMCQGVLVPSSSRVSSPLLNHEDKGTTLLWKVCNFWPISYKTWILVKMAVRTSNFSVHCLFVLQMKQRKWSQKTPWNQTQKLKNSCCNASVKHPSLCQRRQENLQLLLGSSWGAIFSILQWSTCCRSLRLSSS